MGALPTWATYIAAHYRAGANPSRGLLYGDWGNGDAIVARSERRLALLPRAGQGKVNRCAAGRKGEHFEELVAASRKTGLRGARQRLTRGCACGRNANNPRVIDRGGPSIACRTSPREANRVTVADAKVESLHAVLPLKIAWGSTPGEWNPKYPRARRSVTFPSEPARGATTISFRQRRRGTHLRTPGGAEHNLLLYLYTTTEPKTGPAFQTPPPRQKCWRPPLLSSATSSRSKP